MQSKPGVGSDYAHQIVNNDILERSPVFIGLFSVAHFLGFRACECDFSLASAKVIRKSGLDRFGRPVNISLVCGGWVGSAPAGRQVGCGMQGNNNQFLETWTSGLGLAACHSLSSI